MADHVFLTGRKQVGKSTLIRKILQSYPGSVGGFCTVRTNTVFDGTFSVHMLPAGMSLLPSRDNLLFVCGCAESEKTIERFEQLGCQILKESLIRRPGLLIMDELGPNEADALLFQTAVLQLLDGDIPILGVLQEAESSFLQEIASHPHVHVMRVTEENRNNSALCEGINRTLFSRICFQ